VSTSSRLWQRQVNLHLKDEAQLVRFANSRIFKKEMSGPTGLMSALFGGLKVSKSYEGGWQSSIQYGTQPLVWRNQDD